MVSSMLCFLALHIWVLALFYVYALLVSSTVPTDMLGYGSLQSPASLCHSPMMPHHLYLLLSSNCDQLSSSAVNVLPLSSHFLRVVPFHSTLCGLSASFSCHSSYSHSWSQHY